MIPEVRIALRRLSPQARLPSYAHADDAGMDLCALAGVEIFPGQRALVGTGIALALPAGYEAQVRPRSGLALKHGITVLNTPGTVDSGYRGEIKVLLINHGQEPFRVEPGMRIAQMVVAPYQKAVLQVVETLEESGRGEGGYGSTGTGPTEA